MTRPECDTWWCWLEWPGWSGVGGVAAIVAILAAAAALAIQVIQGGRYAVALGLRVTSDDVVRDGWKVFTVELTPMGSEPLYELSLLLIVPNDDPLVVIEPLEALAIGSHVAEQQVRVPLEHVPDSYLIAVWTEAGRSPMAGGLRMRLKDGATAWWKPYRYRLWPRRRSGRWKPTDRSPWYWVDPTPDLTIPK